MLSQEFQDGTSQLTIKEEFFKSFGIFGPELNEVIYDLVKSQLSLKVVGLNEKFDLWEAPIDLVKETVGAELWLEFYIKLLLIMEQTIYYILHGKHKE